jgi:hypothetical protein
VAHARSWKLQSDTESSIRHSLIVDEREHLINILLGIFKISQNDSQMECAEPLDRLCNHRFDRCRIGDIYFDRAAAPIPHLRPASSSA